MRWADKQLKKMDLWDIKLIKIGMIALTLAVASKWPVVASLDWYWYAGVFILAVIRPYHKMFFKK